MVQINVNSLKLTSSVRKKYKLLSFPHHFAASICSVLQHASSPVAASRMLGNYSYASRHIECHPLYAT